MVQLTLQRRILVLGLCQLFGEAPLPKRVQFHGEVVSLFFKPCNIALHLVECLLTAIDLQRYRIRFLRLQRTPKRRKLLPAELHDAIGIGKGSGQLVIRRPLTRRVQRLLQGLRMVLR